MDEGPFQKLAFQFKGMSKERQLKHKIQELIENPSKRQALLSIAPYLKPEVLDAFDKLSTPVRDFILSDIYQKKEIMLLPEREIALRVLSLVTSSGEFDALNSSHSDLEHKTPPSEAEQFAESTAREIINESESLMKSPKKPN
ncbi:hypothetical protein K8Q98_02730 [Candidatus Nomurabacteria bacterium]|nr:hypothetical protein [Candidatus Nomurabacteria bacterium]